MTFETGNNRVTSPALSTAHLKVPLYEWRYFFALVSAASEVRRKRRSEKLTMFSSEDGMKYLQEYFSFSKF